MQTYQVSANQNIFDVAIAIYGSIEGLFDLLVNNPDLSFDSKLINGMQLYYDENFIEQKTIVEKLSSEGIVPANGERHVYYKETDKELRCIINVTNDEEFTKLIMSGDGVITVDWGDNSDLEDIVLNSLETDYIHYFDNIVYHRQIRLYGDFNIKKLDISEINGQLFPVKPIVVDEIEIRKNQATIQGLFLFKNTYFVKMNNIKISDLSPIQNMSLSYLELKNIDYVSSDTLDNYLIHIAKHYNNRRNCSVVIDSKPTGIYQEPKRDTNGNYVITSGMEAVYVITHEDAWNASGAWVFNICGTEYKYENSDIS